MNGGHISEIKAKLSIYASKRTVNAFDGSYKSIYKGSSLNFEDLREYMPGDNIRDIDWKASSRNRNLLVRRYIAEKKHNIMIIFDTGKKMSGDTVKGENKKKLALMLGGTLGYIAARNGDFVGSLFNNNGLIRYEFMRLGINNLEFIMAGYEGGDNLGADCELTKTLEFMLKNINRKMIVFVITDEDGVSSIPDNMYDKLLYRNDLLFIRLSDAMLTQTNSFDLDTDMYFPGFITSNKKLKDMENTMKQQQEDENEEMLHKHGIANVKIDCEEEMVEKVVELLEKHRYANRR